MSKLPDTIPFSEQDRWPGDPGFVASEVRKAETSPPKVETPAPAETPEAGTPEPAGGEDLIPVRMLSEYAYCPRLFHLMHIDGLWADNEYTEDGKRVHRRVDRLDHVLPDAGSVTQTAPAAETALAAGDEPPLISRSVPLGSPRLGLTAKLDLVSSDGAEAVPVETKRGKVPDNPERSWEPERVQLMAQGLLLREHGYRCDHGILYYAGSRTRVAIEFSADLEARTLHLLHAAQTQMKSSVIPEPLEDSPKCKGCSLSGICLPDETLALRAVPPDPAAPEVRRLYPSRSDASPLYVQEQGAWIGTKDRMLVVRKDGEDLAKVSLKDLDHLVILGNVQIGTQALALLFGAGIPVAYCSTGHWFHGISQGITLKNAYDRAAQFAQAAKPEFCLALARCIVVAKTLNQRTLLLRNAEPRPQPDIDVLQRMQQNIEACGELTSLLGLEGLAARHYFSAFGSMLRPPSGTLEFSFEQRNRRPPLDPVNAMLSFGYAILAKECTVALLCVGLDPFWGFYHQPRHGRPALALDLMEEFRPLIVDSTVITCVNNGMVSPQDFTRSKAGCLLKPAARKAFIKAFENRMDQLATHPVFGYRASWRALLRMQARLLARHLRGDIPAYQGITTR